MARKKKKKRVLKIKNILILLIILACIGGFFYYAITLPVQNIYVKGNSIISDNEIIELSKLYSYPSFLLTKKSEIKKNLSKNKYIKNVVIKKKIGNIIELNITEYKIVAMTPDNKVIKDNGIIEENIYKLGDIPILTNKIEDNKMFINFTTKFSKINSNILRQISEIEYSPVQVDNERFLLYMSDGNLVYITLTKITKINKYNKIRDKLNGKTGIIYLDAGNYVELKTNDNDNSDKKEENTE